MTFDRKRLVKKPSKVKSIYTRNAREKERIDREPKKPFHERMGIWSYTLTALGLGVSIGVGFGEFAHSLVATTDEKLIEDIKFYKEQSRIANNEGDSLKNENELLLSEKESLLEQLTIIQKDNKTLNESLNKVNEELKQFKDIEATNTNSTSGNMSKVDTEVKPYSEQKDVNLNESVSFFEGKINVGTFGISAYSTSIQIGADGYGTEKHYSASVGSQFDYESDSKYQIRINKIDYGKDKIVVQVTKF